MTIETLIFPPPVDTDQNDGAQLYVMAMRFSCSVVGSWTGVQWRVPDSLSAINHYILAYDVDLTGDEDWLRSNTVVPVAGGIQNFNFSGGPFTLVAGHEYLACVLTNHYVFTPAYPFPQTNGHLTGTTCQLGTTIADTAKFPGTVTALNFHISPIVDISSAPTAAGAHTHGHTKNRSSIPMMSLGDL
jgi:hypothetical protein